MYRTLIAVALIVAPGIAPAQVIERVVAIVDGEPIFATDLMARMGEAEHTREALRAELQRMIDERLMATAASRNDVHIDADAVQHALDAIRASSGLTVEEFWAAIAAQGVARETYLAELRDRLVRVRLVPILFPSHLRVEEAELRRRYEARVAGAGGVVVRGRVITFSVEGGTNAAEARAQAVLAELRAENITFEDALAANSGGPFGPIEVGELLPALTRALEQLAVGDTSDVIRGGEAFHILRLEGRERAEAPTFESLHDELRAELMSERFRWAEEALIERLRRRAFIIRRI